jgi:hypothetical protein
MGDCEVEIAVTIKICGGNVAREVVFLRHRWIPNGQGFWGKKAHLCTHVASVRQKVAVAVKLRMGRDLLQVIDSVQIAVRGMGPAASEALDQDRNRE